MSWLDIENRLEEMETLMTQRGYKFFSGTEYPGFAVVLNLFDPEYTNNLRIIQSLANARELIVTCKIPPHNCPDIPDNYSLAFVYPSSAGVNLLI